jgi:saccharopine dehydrogenase-like NADP-dependent oxidoreductase
MTDRILILGGRGRIGSSVAADLLAHTQAHITITGRTADVNPSRSTPSRKPEFLAVELSDRPRLSKAIAAADLVIHCAGPFRYRDGSVLRLCIDQGVNYIDVSDDRSFTRRALDFNAAAQSANVTAIVNSGVFPGISNSMVRQAVEQFDTVDTIHLSYVVAGSGGAGVTVMRTTFLGLQHSFEVWLDGAWHSKKPYTERELIDFPAPFGRTGVYWFDMPEAFTLVESFAPKRVPKNVIVKFGSAPDFYNLLTSLVANRFPAKLVQNPGFIEWLSSVGHGMTVITDRFSGIGVAMQSEVSGEKAGKVARYCSTFTHSSTATAAGYGTGSLAELVLSGRLNKPGVWAIEQALPTDLFESAMQSRGVTIQQHWR